MPAAPMIMLEAARVVAVRRVVDDGLVMHPASASDSLSEVQMLHLLKLGV